MVQNVSSIIQYIIPQDHDGIKFEAKISADIYKYIDEAYYQQYMSPLSLKFKFSSQQDLSSQKPVEMCITRKVFGKKKEFTR